MHERMARSRRRRSYASPLDPGGVKPSLQTEKIMTTLQNQLQPLLRGKSFCVTSPKLAEDDILVPEREFTLFVDEGVLPSGHYLKVPENLVLTALIGAYRNAKPDR